MSEFDWWESSRLDVLVRALRGCDNEPPPPSDTGFWEKVVSDVLKADPSVDDLDSEELANDVQSEFESAKLMQPIPGIHVGDLSCAESRLVGLVKGIQGVVYIASHPMESLWAADGINYHTIVVSIQEPSKTLSSQLRSAVAFMATHRPALVCSSCPALPACVLAAFHHVQSGGGQPILDYLRMAETELSLQEGEVGASDRDELETFARLYAPASRPCQISKTPPPPPAYSKPPGLFSSKIQPERRDSTETQVDEELEEELAAEEARQDQDALNTPRMRPAKEPLSIGAVSYDGTRGAFESEHGKSIETPTDRGKFALAPTGTTPITASKDGIITRGGRWKRNHVTEQGGSEMMLESPTKKAREGILEMALHSKDHTNEAPLAMAGTKEEADESEAAEEAAAIADALGKYVRGDCTRCDQVRVLGWANIISGTFECCACHDAHDEDEEIKEAGLACVQQPATALRACCYES